MRRLSEGIGSAVLLAGVIAPVAVVAAITMIVVFGVAPTSSSFGDLLFAFIPVAVLVGAGSVSYLLYLVNVRAPFTPSQRASWSMAVLLAYPIGTIAFWYRYVWRA